jgi:hypothetical protein
LAGFGAGEEVSDYSRTRSEAIEETWIRIADKRAGFNSVFLSIGGVNADEGNNVRVDWDWGSFG